MLFIFYFFKTTTCWLLSDLNISVWGLYFVILPYSKFIINELSFNEKCYFNLCWRYFFFFIIFWLVLSLAFFRWNFVWFWVGGIFFFLYLFLISFFLLCSFSTFVESFFFYTKLYEFCFYYQKVEFCLKLNYLFPFLSFLQKTVDPNKPSLWLIKTCFFK